MFVFAIIILVIALILGFVVIGVAATDDLRQYTGAWVAVFLGALAFGLVWLFFFDRIAVVGTKEVGIVTAFNKPTGALDNGFHLIAPWETVTEMDAAIQTDSHLERDKACVPTRIAHQIIACTDVTIRWRIREAAADELFRDYRDFANVRTSLVSRELATDINNQFQAYDPLAVDENGNSTQEPLSSLSGQVLGDMREQIGGQIEVLSVFVPVLHFDGAVQGRINALQAQIAQTRIATQAVKTAQEQAAANSALAATVSTDPNVLVSKCLDLLNEAINKGFTLPAGFGCWPGGGTGVVIPGR